MISILLAIKIFILFLTIVLLGIAYFHIKETGRIENRLGILLPAGFKRITNLNILYIATLSILFLLFLLV